MAPYRNLYVCGMWGVCVCVCVCVCTHRNYRSYFSCKYIIITIMMLTIIIEIIIDCKNGNWELPLIIDWFNN